MFRKSRYSAGKRRKNAQSCDTAVANFPPQVRKFENSVVPKKILKSEMKKVPLRILCTFATCPATRGSRSDGQGTILHDSTYCPCPASAVFLLLSDPLRSAYNSPAKASSGKRTSNLLATGRGSQGGISGSRASLRWRSQQRAQAATICAGIRCCTALPWITQAFAASRAMPSTNPSKPMVVAFVRQMMSTKQRSLHVTTDCSAEPATAKSRTKRCQSPRVMNFSVSSTFSSCSGSSSSSRVAARFRSVARRSRSTCVFDRGINEIRSSSVAGSIMLANFGGGSSSLISLVFLTSSTTVATAFLNLLKPLGVVGFPLGVGGPSEGLWLVLRRSDDPDKVDLPPVDRPASLPRTDRSYSRPTSVPASATGGVSVGACL